MSNRFYEIQIGEISLTDDGTADGTPCKLNIANLEDILTNVIGQPSVSASGAVVSNLASWTKGKSFEITELNLTESVWADLKDLIADALENDTAFPVTGTGAIGDFTVSAKPNPLKPFTAQRFIGDRIFGITLRLITA